MRNPLLDKDFLKKLDEQRNKEVFAKIIALTFDEQPTEEISGKISSGSISVDGTSAIRRSCSISMVAQEVNINEYYWGLNTKILVYVGLKNLVDDKYPDIIWFKQGVFIITSFSTSQSTNGYDISIQGKDKMSLLNGDLGGVIGSLTHDFGTIRREQKDGNVIVEKVPLKDVIREVVATYAHEPYYNIIVNDLDEMGLELLEYRGKEYLYMLIDSTANEYYVENLIINGKQRGYYLDRACTQEVYLDGELVSNSNSKGNIIYDSRIKLDFGNVPSKIPTKIYVRINGEVREYTIARFEYGETCGYRLTDLTFAGDFIGNVGQSITQACLDRITNMLGNFEYYYDIDGRFIFQKKKTYVNTSWNNITSSDGETFVTSAADTSASVYHFEDGNLISAYSNSPDYANLRNDFSIWGEKKSITGDKTIPIHLRYAIDKKPTYYRSYSGHIFTTEALEPYEVWLQRITEEAIIEIEREIEIARETYIKNPNPNGLSEDWWEILDWAKYYCQLAGLDFAAGDGPPGKIGQYANAGNGGAGIEPISLTNYFEIAKDGKYSNIKPGQNFKIYIFDVDYNINYPGSMTIGYTGHGTGCSHEYSYFIKRALEGTGTSYIYKPIIPDEEQQSNKNELIQERIKQKVMGIDSEQKYYEMSTGKCEWREIIYQMAIDYNNYCNKDDFRAVIAANNSEYYPSGLTGYEQYYIDMSGFWRDLYNPEITAYDTNQAPDTNIANFYTWDAEKKQMIPYSFKEMTNIKTPDKNVTYYLFKNGSYTPMVHYDSTKKYYKYREAINLLYALYKPMDNWYYEKIGENNYRRVDDIVQIPDKVDDNGDILLGVNFELGKQYYKYLGYAKVESFTIGTQYYIQKPNVNEESVKTIIDTYKQKGYYPEADNEIFTIGFITNRQTEYFAKNPNTNVYERASILVRGTQYYVKNGNNYVKALYLDPNKDYYQYNGYTIVYDLSKLSKTSLYCYEDNNGERHAITNYKFPTTYNIYQYQLVDAANLTNSKYYIGDNALNMTELYLLKEFKRNESYAVIDASIPEYSVYARPFDNSLVYYKYNNGTYIRQNGITSFDGESDYYIKKSNADYVKYEGLFKPNISYFIKTGNDTYESIALNSSTFDANNTYYIYSPQYELYTRAFDIHLNYYTKNENNTYSIIKLTKFERGVTYYIKENQYKDFNIFTYKDFGEKIYIDDKYNPDSYWNLNINNPSQLIFWFDFLDVPGGDLEKFSVPVIGDRPKAINDSDVKSIYYKETPTVVFVNSDKWEEEKDKTPGFTYVKLPSSMEGLFSISSQGKSATTVLDEFLYNNTYCTESISVTSIPIYYLEPNTRIFIDDENSKICGEYLVSRYSIPLSHNGTMNISATKAVERLY